MSETASPVTPPTGVTQTVCKFRCTEVAKLDWGNGAERVKLSAQYDPTLPEDQKFQKATPTGSFESQIDNPAVFGFFQPGKSYMVTITPVD